MNIFVIATTLQAGGGITIYKQFLSHLPEHIGQNRYWIFINPVLPQVEIEGVTYISFPLQSKVKRILFEGKRLKAEAAKLGVKPDVVVSLQNNGYRCFKNCKQIVYFHQSLPLYPGDYNPFKRSERYLFNYKYIFPCVVKRTWSTHTQFVVQTPVVKKRFVSYFDVCAENVHVCFPDIENIDVSQGECHNWEDDCFHFLYVSACAKYQNGLTLIKAVKLLQMKNPTLAKKIRVHITRDIYHAAEMYRQIQEYKVGDSFVFDGVIKHDDLLSYYKSATALIFPSSVETVGLPMLEAAAFGLPVLAADVDYAHEVMKDYEGTVFIDVNDYETWANMIMNKVENHEHYKPLPQDRKSDWKYFFDLIDIV